MRDDRIGLSHMLQVLLSTSDHDCIVVVMVLLGPGPHDAFNGLSLNPSWAAWICQKRFLII